MSVYPAGVKQYYREELTAATGAVTAINHPCVVKAISARPVVTTQPDTNYPSMILKIFDGTDSFMVMRFAGSVGGNVRNDNSTILVPAIGIKINTSLGIEVEVINGHSLANSDLTYSSISVMYQ